MEHEGARRARDTRRSDDTEARGLVGLRDEGSQQARTADPVRCAGRIATIVGTNGPDRLFGTPADDVIAALGGRDRVHGGEGDDVVCGGPDRDRLYGGRGHDTLRGQARQDILVGRSGDDRLYGGSDELVSRADGVHVLGDTLWPGAGRDFVDAGDDPRQGPLGNGNDRPDSVRYSDSPAAIVARLADPGDRGTVSGPGGVDVVVGQRVVELVGTLYDDTIIGGAGSERLLALRGHDRLVGRGGDDALFDGDRIKDGERLAGGPGSDLIVSRMGPDRISGGPGDDDVRFVQRNHPYGPAPCAAVRAGPGHDQLSIFGSSQPMEFDAGDGRLRVGFDPHQCDVMVGFEAYLMSTDSQMSFIGTEASEELEAVGVNGVTARMMGGDDVAIGTNADDNVDAGAGNDRVEGRGGTDICVGAEHATGCEASAPQPHSCDGLPATIVSLGAPGLPVLGTEGPDVIVGSDERDEIDGLGGDDVVCALGGSDLVDAGSGNDRVFGGDDGVDDSFLLGDQVVPGPGDDRVDLGIDARRLSGSAGSGEVVDYSTSETAITTVMTPVDGTFTVAGQGTDTITAQSELELWGSALADVITGGPGDDRIVGKGGDDVVDGAGGDDEVFGDDDCHRTICGHGPADHDVVRGGDGDDTVTSGRGPDELDGGAGNDVLEASHADSARSILGGFGEDRIYFDVQGPMNVDVDGGPDADVLLVEGRSPSPRTAG